MAYDPSTELTPEEQITLLYVAYYDRAPDPAGLAHWKGRLEENLDGAGDGDPGLTLLEIADKFAASAESQAVYPDFLGDQDGDGVADGNNPGGFVGQVYINLFGRIGDTAGVNHWVNNINNGNITPAEALVKIIKGAQGSDVAVLENKVDVGLDWHDSFLADGGLNLSPADATEARQILDGVNATQASVDAAKDQTDAFFNDAPVATDDTASVNEDSSVNIDVLGNDTDVDGDTLTVTSAGGASNGTVTVNGDGTIDYTPDADFNGTDSFTYTVSDGNGGTDTATVDVTVDAVNDNPVASDDAASTNEDASVVINVLGNDTDVDGDTLSVFAVGAASNGAVVDNGDGTITYTPDLDFTGSDSFTYTVSDGNGGFNTATVSVDVNAVAGETFVLTPGTDASPDFDGGEGNDTYLASESTLNNVDNLNAGGAGQDSDLLKISIQQGTGSFFAAPTLKDFEEIEVNGPNLDPGQNITLDLSNLNNTDALEENPVVLRSFQTTVDVPQQGAFTVAPGAPLVSFRDIQSVNNTSLEIIDTNAHHLFTYDSNAFQSLFVPGPGDTKDNANIKLQEVNGSDITLALEDPVPGTPGGQFRSHVDTVSIDSQARTQENTTAFNYVHNLTVGPVFTTLNIEGNAHFEIEHFLEGPTSNGPTPQDVIGGVNTVNADTLDGDLTLDLIGQGVRVPHNSPVDPHDTPFDVTGGNNPLNPNGTLTVFGAAGNNNIDVSGDTNGLFEFQEGHDVLRVGNSVDVGGGTDDFGNDVYVRQDVFGDLVVSTEGGNDDVILNITGEQNVDLGSGHDRLLINGNVDDLGSRDNVLVGDQYVTFAQSQVFAREGNDYVELNGIAIDRPEFERSVEDLDNDYFVDLGIGHDTLIANQGGDHIVFGQAGDDDITITGNGFQSINSGADNDAVSIFGDGNHEIFLEGGNDSLFISGSRLPGNNFDTVDPQSPFIPFGGEPNGGETTINAGTGNDYVGVDGDHDLRVDMGDGQDTVELNADELTVDDLIEGGNGDGDNVDDTVILHNVTGNIFRGNVGRSETSSTTGIEVYDLRDTNITLALSSDNFDTSVDKKITVKTTEAGSYELAQHAFLPTVNKMTVDITDIPMSVASGRSFELEGGTIRDVIIADDASISSRLTLDFDGHPRFSDGDVAPGAPTFAGDSREDTLQVINGANISAADQQNFSGLDIIELLADSNQAQSWNIQVTEDTINQSSDDAPFKIQVDPNVGAGSTVLINVDPSTYGASMDDLLIIETNANAEIYIDFNDGNGPQLIGEPLWGTELLANFGLNVPSGGGIYVQERLMFTQNTDSLIGDQIGAAAPNDTFIVDSMSKLQEADSADGLSGTNTLLFDNVTVSNQNEDLYDQIDKVQLDNIQRFVFDTGMNVQMNRLDDALDGNDLQNMLTTLVTGSGNDTLLDMETIGNNRSEGYFLGGGDDFFSTYPDDFFAPEGTPSDGTSSEDYYVDGGLGDDEVVVRDQDDLFGTDIETIYLYEKGQINNTSLDGADADLWTVQGVDGSSMVVFGDEDDTESNDVDLNSSIRQASNGNLATVFLYDIEDVDDFGGDQIIVLDNNESGPDGDANISLNAGNDDLTVTNVDDLIVSASSGTKTVSIGEAGPGTVHSNGSGGTGQPNSSVNSLNYTGGTGVDDVVAVIDDNATVNGNDGDDILNVTSTQAGAIIVNGGDGDDLITARSIGGTVTTSGGDGADTFFVRTELGETSSIDTGLGADDAGDVVNLYFPDLVAGGDPFAGEDTIVFGTIVYDTTQEIVTEDNTNFPGRPFTTQNFIQNALQSTEIDGVNDSKDTIKNFNMETLGNAEDIIDVDAFIAQFGGDDGADGVGADDFAYGDWTGGGTTVLRDEGADGDLDEVAVIEVNQGFELNASHIIETGDAGPGIEVDDNGGRIVAAGYDTNSDGNIDTVDLYMVQDVDQDGGQAWAVDKVGTFELATEIGSINSIDEDNFFYQ